MKIYSHFEAIVITMAGILCASAAVTLFAHERGSDRQARIAIERLHQADVKATLSGKADDFAELWDKDAVRILPGNPAEIGKATIYANDKREQANANRGRTLCYTSEIKDLQIAGDWAVEWGYFSYKESATAKPGRGKVMRVIKRQPDGSWKFARLIGFPETVESAAPMSHACE